MTRPKTKCTFNALLHFVAGFLMTRQKLLYLIVYTWKSRFSYDATEKSVHLCIISFRTRFSHDVPKTLSFDAFLRGKAGFLMTRQKGAILLHYYYHDAPKTILFNALIRGKASFLITRPKAMCTFDALLRFIAGFLMPRQKLLYLMHYYVEKQVFS